MVRVGRIVPLQRSRRMTRINSRWVSRLAPALAVAATLCVSTDALADNPLGLYVGAGVGTATVENKYEFYDPNGFSGRYHDHDAAWKVIAGLKPIPLVGAEVEYIDFGNAGGNSQIKGAYTYTSVSAHPKATVLYGLGYLPIPLPFIDVYG
jgi:opacity protein-like surface antigen